MANLDTRNKRGSAIGIDLSFVRVFPNPDGAITQADRQQTPGKYSGILATGGNTGDIKYWTGASFIAKPVKVWNGASFVKKPLKYWNGSSWITTPY